MEIGASSYGVNGLWDLNAASEIDSTKKYKKIESEITPSGDSVEISDEAKELFSQMIHKYDHSSGQDTSSGNGGEAQGEAGGGGAGGSSSSTSDVESLKNQIQSLKSQLSSLATQASTGDNAALSKMNALEAQIAALEAQLNAMGQA